MIKVNKEYLERLLKEHKELRHYCIDIEDLLSFMLDYVNSNMQYDFNIDIDKNELIIKEGEDYDKS